jgi:hypothetical protein
VTSEQNTEHFHLSSVTEHPRGHGLSGLAFASSLNVSRCHQEKQVDEYLDLQ